VVTGQVRTGLKNLFLGNFQIFWKIFRFSENVQIFEKISDFRKNFRCLENVQIFGQVMS